MATKKVTKKEVVEKKTTSIDSGLISYILGIVAIVEAIVSPFAGLVLGIVGVAFSQKGSGVYAKRGKKMGIVAIVLGIIVFVLVLLSSTLLASTGIK